MVQGHVFTALLDPHMRMSSWFRWHNYVHGLTAPIFFFSSGLAFGVATFRHWPSHTRWGPPTARRFERYGWLLFIGYMLSLPKLSFRQLLSASEPEQARTFFEVGALENIAVSLILVQGLVWLLQKQRRFAVAVALLGMTLVFAAPVVWRLPVEDWLPIGIASYVNANTGSVFPLFPWTGFLCAGVVTGYLSLDSEEASLRPHRGLALAIVGAASWGLASRLEGAGVDLFGEHDYWKTSPIFFFTRLGLILLVFAMLCAYENHASGTSRSRRHIEHPTDEPDLLQRISEETLVIYVAHLFLLYGSPVNPGLTMIYPGTVGLGAATMIALVILVCSTFCALLWRHLRQRSPKRFRAFQFGLAGLVVLVALVKP